MKLTSALTLRKFFYELFIVVFGILIALWVDNLASDISDRKKERELLNSFLGELQRDTATFRSEMNRFIERDSSARFMISYINHPIEANPEKICDCLVSIISVIGPPVSNAVFQDLKNGSLHLIQNNKLRTGLIHYYTFQEHQQQWNRDLKAEISPSFNPVISDLMTYEQIFEDGTCNAAEVLQRISDKDQLIRTLDRARKIAHFFVMQIDTDIRWAEILMNQIHEELNK